MTKKELIIMTTSAEFALAMHARAATHAVDARRKGWTEDARWWAQAARRDLAAYLHARAV